MKKLVIILLLLFFYVAINQKVSIKTALSENLNFENKFDEISYNLVRSEKFMKNINLIDLNGNKYSLKEAIGNSPKFIIKFSDSQCSWCMKHIKKYLSIYKKYIDDNDVIFIGDFRSRHDFTVFARLNDINKNLYKTLNINDFGLESIDTLKIPYIITSDNDLKVQNVFIPLKEIPKRTNDFFKLKVKLNGHKIINITH